MDETIITPETHPNHHTVGHHFGGYRVKTSLTEIYYCDSYDPAIGYWMTNVNDETDRRNVSERAIGRTFHEVVEHEDSWVFIYLGGKIPKVPKKFNPCDIDPSCTNENIKKAVLDHCKEAGKVLSWDETTTDKEMDNTLKAHCDASKKQLENIE